LCGEFHGQVSCIEPVPVYLLVSVVVAIVCTEPRGNTSW